MENTILCKTTHIEFPVREIVNQIFEWFIVVHIYIYKDIKGSRVVLRAMSVGLFVVTQLLFSERSLIVK